MRTETKKEGKDKVKQWKCGTKYHVSYLRSIEHMPGQSRETTKETPLQHPDRLRVLNDAGQKSYCCTNLLSTLRGWQRIQFNV